MPYWLDWMMRDSQFPLSKRNKRLLYGERKVKSELKKGRNPIEVSLEKWKRIATVLENIRNEPIPGVYFKALSKRAGYETCALCLDSTARYLNSVGKMKFGSDKCKICPLSAVDACLKKDSVYAQIDKLLVGTALDVATSDDRKNIERLITLSGMMIANLESIDVKALPDGEAG